MSFKYFKVVLTSVLVLTLAVILGVSPSKTLAAPLLIDEEFEIDMNGEYDEEAHNERFLKIWEELYEDEPVEEPSEKSLIQPFSNNTLSYYVSSTRWINRNGQISLSSQPKSTLTSHRNGNEALYHSATSFNLLRQKHGRDSQWRNTNSMRVQWDCHVLMARSLKTPWNIEPHRTTTDLKYTMQKFCNPPNR
ncbi:DUF2599 domain-containing protein [Alkalihalophilus sp. As8PL]|uniref:DUF2599 domain-containing protein n=1 Tax=Alkalihalophilus sp. As8PL TaxID=3237103 RepID=A0AB39BSJ6_9BACI